MNKIIDTIHHFFVPRHTNNYSAKLLHHDFLTVYLVAALAITIGVSHIQSTMGGSILGYATDVTTSKLLELTNEERADANLPPLEYNEQLAQAAELKAQNMFEKDYWSHYGPAGETPWQYILESGYQYEYAGENLAKNFLFSDGVVGAWMNSETHKENILRSEYSDVGFAVVNGILDGEETTLVVQMFGKPLYETHVADTGTAGETQTAQAEQTAPQEIPASQQEAVLANGSEGEGSSFFPIYFNLNMAFFAILAAALLLDFYFAAKLNLIRIKGKNLAHMMFIVFIVAGAFIIIRGSII